MAQACVEPFNRVLLVVPHELVDRGQEPVATHGLDRLQQLG